MTVKRLADEEIAELRKHLLYPHLTHRMEASLPRLLDEVTAARALLRRIEWEGMNGDELSVCPACYGISPSELVGHREQSGHKPDCELAAVIGKAP